MTRASTRAIGAAALVLLAAACAPPRPPALPSGAGVPLPDFTGAYREAIRGCAAISTYTAVLSLSGRAGHTKLRGRIEAGFAVPSKMRLTGVPPFGGRPMFVLTAAGPQGTLVLPRDGRVLSAASPADIVQALAGVPLGSDDLRSAVTGCGLWGDEQPTAGRGFPNGWSAVDFADGTAYLHAGTGPPQLAAAKRGSVTIYYADYANGRPGTIRVIAESAGRVTADLTLRPSQVDIDAPLDERVFTADVPEDATPITLDELRRAGPLGADR